MHHGRLAVGAPTTPGDEDDEREEGEKQRGAQHENDLPTDNNKRHCQ